LNDLEYFDDYCVYLEMDYNHIKKWVSFKTVQVIFISFWRLYLEKKTTWKCSFLETISSETFFCIINNFRENWDRL